MSNHFNVLFAGQLLDGHEFQAVREKLATLFNADAATLDKLFSGKPQIIKRDCDEATAAKYQAAMARAGAAAILQPAETVRELTAAEKIAALAATPDNAPASESTGSAVNSAPAAASSAPAEPADGIVLAPPETAVLQEHERAVPQAVDIDTSALSIDEQAERLSEAPPQPPSAPDTSHLAMGEVGDDIPNLPSDTTPLNPDIDGISLTEAGTDFSDCNKPPAQAPNLDLSGLDVAPEGTELIEEQYRQRADTKAPPTDHLSIED